MIVRPEEAADAPAVRRVLEAAFGGKTEADFVDRLHADGDFVLSLVAVAEDDIVGYAGFPRLVLETEGRAVPVCGLAPLAVRLDRQRAGIGTMLTRAGLERLGDRAEALVFVLGEPAYYGRSGFDAQAAADFTCVYAGRYFQVRRLRPMAPFSGAIRYPRAFDELG